MPVINLICDAKKARKDGISNIYLKYNFTRNKHPLLNTGIAIPFNCWDSKKAQVGSSLPEKYGNPYALNKEIKRQFRLLEDLIDLMHEKGIPDKGSFAASIFRPDLDLCLLADDPTIWNIKSTDVPKKNCDLDIYAQLDEYIKVKAGSVSQSTLTIYKNVGDHLRQFEEYRKEPITFNSFDFNFYDHFVHFLTFDYIQLRSRIKKKGLRKNSISKTVKNLRLFLQDRSKRKIIKPIDLECYYTAEEEADAIYLTVNEIKKIYTCDLSAYPDLIPDRNRFVIACLTGFRFSDLIRITPADIRNDAIHLKQEKSNAKVVVPLRSEAKEMLTQIFDQNIPMTSNPEFNRNVKIIGKLAGIKDEITFSYLKGNQKIKVTKAKCDWITSHTGRRSFCTNEFLAGTPVSLIMKISGHKKEKNFYKYIRVSEEEAAEKIREIWQSRVSKVAN